LTRYEIRSIVKAQTKKERPTEAGKEMIMDKYNDLFKEIYGYGTTMTVTTEDGSTISGIMFGNDECFDVNEFYQILVAGGKVYKCYYQLPEDDDGDLSNIDYEHPYRVDDCTRDYEDVV